ncbi:hypothetical protein J4E91_004518 [Alternaria rosae]|nr:hypothetical protein J4E91_004518 [Alternaria rosae]
MLSPSFSEIDGEALPFIEAKEEESTNRPQRRQQSIACINPLVALPWLLVILCIGYILAQDVRSPSELECTRLLNPYSPLIEAGVIEYYDADFDNEFAHKTAYRGPPTVELESAWDRLWRRGSTEVPADRIGKLNRSSSKLVHAGGDPSRGYVALLEVSHELHCLNMIRQYTWKDYYREHADQFLNSEIDLNITDARNVGDRMHVDHCFETLRLVLMCNADVTPSLIINNTNKPHGTKADFNTFHKCRNFDRIVDWQEKHNADLHGEH